MIKVDITTEDGVNPPTYKSNGAAGCDLRSNEDTAAYRDETIIVRTGLYVAIPKGFEMQIRSRSGMACNGIVVSNSPGTIDSDYRGEIKIILHNRSDRTFKIKKGDRIAQAVFAPVIRACFLQVLSLDETERGDGGLGSTGVE